jgi:excisionase family DNA binding protein
MPELEANPVLAELAQITKLLRELVARERFKSRRLLRVGEAAVYLNLSAGRFRGLVQRGEIPVIRTCSKTDSNGDHVPWLVDIQDLDQWVERSKISK